MPYQQILKKLTLRTVTLFCILGTVAATAGGTVINGSNKQIVTLKGGSSNIAGHGSTAVMNIASVQNRTLGANSQIVDIHGTVLNSANYGSSSILNIASKTATNGASGDQIIQIKGPVVNSSAGSGVVSEINIGGGR